MSQHPHAIILRYGCAVVGVALAIWVRLLLDPVLGEHYPFAVIWLAVLGTAWYGGFRPALAAAILGAVGSNYFLIAPRGSFELTSVEQRVGMALYLVIGLAIALFGGSLHAAEGARREANARLEARVRERTEELGQANDRLRTSEERLHLIVHGVSSHAIYTPPGND